MTDTERLDWLELDAENLTDVRGRVSKDVSVRDAIDWIMAYERSLTQEAPAPGILPPGTYTFTGPLK